MALTKTQAHRVIRATLADLKAGKQSVVRAPGASAPASAPSAARTLFFPGLLMLATVASDPSHAAERDFVPIPSDGQEIRYDDGETVLFTKQESAELAVVFVPRDKKSAWVKIWAENLGTQPFNISDTSVTAVSAGSPLLVLTYADRLKEERRKEMWAGIAAGFAAAGNSISASNAGYSHQYGTINGTTTASVYGSGGYASGTANTYGSYSGTTYNAAAAQQAQAAANAQNQAIFARNQSNAAYAQQDLKGRALKANTLMLGQSVTGDVRFVLPKKSKDAPTELVITIDLAGKPVSILYREAVAK